MTFGLFCKITLTRSEGQASSADTPPPTQPETAAFLAVISPINKFLSAQALPEKASAQTGVAKAIGVAIPMIKFIIPASRKSFVFELLFSSSKNKVHFVPILVKIEYETMAL